MFKCKLCAKVFSAARSLKMHNKNVPNCKRLQCQQCRAVFKTAKTQKLHRCKGASRVKKLECPACSKRFGSEFSFKRHLKKQHQDTAPVIKEEMEGPMDAIEMESPGVEIKKETDQWGVKMAADIKFNPSLSTTDPHFHPVLIIGQLRHLNLLNFSDVACKLKPRVTEETFKNAISCLHPSPTDRCSLYLDFATVATVPLKCSRHNTPSRAHAVTRLVKNNVTNVGEESVVIVCERADLFASACAVVRAFPLYSRKTAAAARRKDESMDSAAINEINAALQSNNSEIADNNPDVLSIEFIIIDQDGKVCETPLDNGEIACLEEAARGVRLAARIVDTPCNEMNVSDFIKEVELVGRELAIVPKIIRGEELRERGFGGIYGVGKAASVPPALVVLSHEPRGAQDTIAFVGKGIVYDTGGLSIKGKTSMPGMKRDCGGAAAILGAFYAAVKCGFNQNLHAVFCLAENSVGPNATRPDDIHTLYSGRTVEINNTDAEGRLVLADGVCFAQKDLKANIILDMATLTGAQGVATGKYHGAILSNNDEWEGKSLDAGRKSGDLLAPLVYCPELHFSEFASAVADMKNSAADRTNALSSCAGLFIGAHLGFGYPGVWLHIDMASPVHNGERATGYGVALLLTLFGNYSNNALLQSIAPFDNEPPTKRACLTSKHIIFDNESKTQTPKVIFFK